MALPSRASSVWIRALLAGGALLALALLAQTIVNYSYVSTNLIRQQARRTAEERVRDVERAARLARPQDAEAFRAILNELRAEMSDQIAALALVHADGSTLASSGDMRATAGPDSRTRVLADRDAPFAQTSWEGREVLVGVLPCRCSLPRQPATAAGQTGTSRLFLEVALYRDSLSAPFTRLRRNAAVSASAALALLVSVTLIAARLRPYVRGKQLEVQAELARQVQRDLLPAADAWPSGLDLGAVCRPAWEVGGDFYDIVTLPDGRVSFALGDVSGHGISAALLMGLIHGAMSSPPWGVSQEDPGRAAERLNQLLIAKSSGDRFASLFWCSVRSGLIYGSLYQCGASACVVAPPSPGWVHGDRTAGRGRSHPGCADDGRLQRGVGRGATWRSPGAVLRRYRRSAEQPRRTVRRGSPDRRHGGAAESTVARDMRGDPRRRQHVHRPGTRPG